MRVYFNHNGPLKMSDAETSKKEVEMTTCATVRTELINTY